MQSTRLPDSWVKSLLDRMAAMYGSAFLSKWEKTDPAAMRDMWADALGAYSGEQIKWALDSLISSGKEFPPGLPEFVALCRQAPRPQPIALPQPKVEPEQARQRMSDLEKHVAEFGRKAVGKEWARDIIANPKQYPPISLKFARMAIGDE